MVAASIYKKVYRCRLELIYEKDGSSYYQISDHIICFI